MHTRSVTQPALSTCSFRIPFKRPTRFKCFASRRGYAVSQSYGATPTLGHVLSGARVGLQVWMLTGDKKDTAKKIGSATGLINSRMLLLEVDLDDDEQCAPVPALWKHRRPVFSQG
eukprot:994050-Pyramimonas_sp.AAC.2